MTPPKGRKQCQLWELAVIERSCKAESDSHKMVLQSKHHQDKEVILFFFFLKKIKSPSYLAGSFLQPILQELIPLSILLNTHQYFLTKVLQYSCPQSVLFTKKGLLLPIR